MTAVSDSSQPKMHPLTGDSQGCSAIVTEEGIASIPTLGLFFGGQLAAVKVAWRLVGGGDKPTIAVLGGISAGRNVFSENQNGRGWWQEIVGIGKPLDARDFRILGIDFLGGSGATTGPRAGQSDFPAISAYDQANLLAQLLSIIGVRKLHAVVGASYGGMVALAFAERHPELVDSIVAISAADRAHPLSTAWRSVQRATVRAFAARGEGAEGLKLARALAMTTYRSAKEFAQRFDSPPTRTGTQFSFPVENYLYARGQAYADNYVPEAFVCLSESIDLHRVTPESITTPTTLVAVVEDQLVPLADMQALRNKLAGPSQLIEVSSLYGHDAFLKETAALRDIFKAWLYREEQSK